MALSLILPQQFTSVLSALTDPGTVYVIPSFQRPYAWGPEQVRDLLRDMEKAHGRKNGSHYLSALHLIGVDMEQESTLVEFLDDSGNEDLGIIKQLFKDGDLRTDHDEIIRVYAVVDGQQRLTTLLMLAHLYYRYERQRSEHLKSGLDLRLRDGRNVPRLIQSPSADHDFMKQILAWTQTSGHALPKAQSQSQRRMAANAKVMRDWAETHREPLRFLRSERFKTSIIELESGYGLTSFLTLNDRGRPLTVLEKLKSLLLQSASEIQELGLTRRLHRTFGQLYRVLDDCRHTGLISEKNGDDEIVKLLSCYIRLSLDGSAIHQSADASYQDFFRSRLLESADKTLSIVGGWCNDIDGMSLQLSQLNRYLNGTLGHDEKSLHFMQPNSLSDDYRVVLLSLTLQPHLMALLLKFRATYGQEWHVRFSVQVPGPNLRPVDELLADVRRQFPSQSVNYLDSLSEISREFRQALSMLEVVERLQLLDWNLGSRKFGTFAMRSKATLDLEEASDFVKSWAAWRGPDDFIFQILHTHNDQNIRYLLKEYERSRHCNIHFDVPQSISSDQIELEHVFAQGIDTEPSFVEIGGFSGFGIADRSVYDNKLLWRSGNLTWISQSANSALGNQLPDVKAAHYRSCHGHSHGPDKDVCSEISITRKIGEELGRLETQYLFFPLYVEARCAELALFSIRRFC